MLCVHCAFWCVCVSPFFYVSFFQKYRSYTSNNNNKVHTVHALSATYGKDHLTGGGVWPGAFYPGGLLTGVTKKRGIWPGGTGRGGLTVHQVTNYYRCIVHVINATQTTSISLCLASASTRLRTLLPWPPPLPQQNCLEPIPACYHLKFGSSATKSVRINRKEPQLETKGSPPRQCNTGRMSGHSTKKDVNYYVNNYHA